MEGVGNDEGGGMCVSEGGLSENVSWSVMEPEACILLLVAIVSMIRKS